MLSLRYNEGSCRKLFPLLSREMLSPAQNGRIWRHLSSNSCFYPPSLNREKTFFKLKYTTVKSELRSSLSCFVSIKLEYFVFIFIIFLNLLYFHFSSNVYFTYKCLLTKACVCHICMTCKCMQTQGIEFGFVDTLNPNDCANYPSRTINK